MNSHQFSLLVVEDSPDQLARILALANEAGFFTQGANSLNSALEILAGKTFSALLTDIHLSPAENLDCPDGLALLEHLKINHPEILALAMSADPNIETYNAAMERGALQFFRKPILNADELKIQIKQAQEKFQLRSQSKKEQNHKIVDNEIAMLCPDGILIPDKLRRFAKKIAEHKRISVTISGETGTGKEELAKLIHRERVAIEGSCPFVAVNCANLNTDLAVALLFGHRKGAFTGADSASIGLIGEAEGGIFFLDEIHALSLPCQQRLLRVLNDGSYERLGETKTRHANFQVISASTRDLDDLVAEGKFMLDLQTRIMGIPLKMEPLRERLEDLPLLIKLYFLKNQLQVGQEQLDKIANRCRSFYWQGNIRLLYKVLDSLVIVSSLNEVPIDAENLPVLKNMLAPNDTEHSTMSTLALKGIPSDALLNLTKALSEDQPLEFSVATFERYLLQGALARHDQIQDAVVALGVSRSGFAAKRKQHGI